MPVEKYVRLLGAGALIALVAGGGACALVSDLADYERVDGRPPEVVTTTSTTFTTSTSGGGGGGGGGGFGGGGFGGGGCIDTAGGLCFDNDPATDDCGSCAFAGPCAALYSACTMNAECVALDGCIGACADQACADQCYVDHATGADDYINMLRCVICDTCPIECDAAGSGC